GSECLKKTILSSAENGTPVTCLVYNLLLPWAAEVACDHNVPLALLWIQPASVFRVYYYYFKGYDKLIKEHCNEPSWSIELPGLPSLKRCDLPSICLPSNTLEHVIYVLKELLYFLDSKEKPKILVNTFDALEEEALEEIDGKINMVGVGPLIPSAFLDGKDPSDRSFGGDLFETSHGYLEWMNTKPEGSIVYISFGTMIVWSKEHKEAMAHALMESKKPFLWTDEDGVFEGEEMRRCTEMVMGGHERGETVRMNAKKWKHLARESIKENGSSYMNLKSFAEEVGSGTEDKVKVMIPSNESKS
ncbi:hypothetical protein M8C21_010128, partial [Ambrosia artemisiifolia]